MDCPFIFLCLVEFPILDSIHLAQIMLLLVTYQANGGESGEVIKGAERGRALSSSLGGGRVSVGKRFMRRGGLSTKTVGSWDYRSKRLRLGCEELRGSYHLITTY